MRNRPGTQIVTHTQIATAFLVSRKCDYLKTLQSDFYECKQIFLSLVVTGTRQTGQRFDG